ncbi:hypothetical protein DUNSADRAFT_64 [Dunaliella salina]|uniref:Uncharacterized protein n=1 Tax=Dunaliella salina TaxID=3046 RepID=A0ABQ7H8S7_DUNSA|nr:hypothetical protein DUNSADRAFT_64 [Dunaliella salina]|eukprot:KAF5843262.1 hypothetical protein DUNSADRAFT_64 [Dunaliella salina]
MLLRVHQNLLDGYGTDSTRLLVGIRSPGGIALFDAVYATTVADAAAALSLLPFGTCLAGAFAPTRQSALQAIEACELHRLAGNCPGPMVVAHPCSLDGSKEWKTAFELQHAPGATSDQLPQNAVQGLHAASPEGIAKELGLSILRCHVTLPLDVYSEVDQVNGSPPSTSQPGLGSQGTQHHQGPSFLKALSCGVAGLEHRLASASSAFVATRPDGQRLVLTPSGSQGTLADINTGVHLPGRSTSAAPSPTSATDSVSTGSNYRPGCEIAFSLEPFSAGASGASSWCNLGQASSPPAAAKSQEPKKEGLGVGGANTGNGSPMNLQGSNSSSNSNEAPLFLYRPVAAGPQGKSYMHSQSQVALDVLMYLPSSTPLFHLCWTGYSMASSSTNTTKTTFPNASSTGSNGSGSTSSSSSSSTCGAMTAALTRQLAVAHTILSQQGYLSDVTAHHFLPPRRTHHVTTLYPKKSADAELNEAKLASHR